MCGSMARWCSCHLFMVDMNRCAATPLYALNFHQLSRATKGSGFGHGFGLLERRKDRYFEGRRLKFVVSAEISNSLSVNFGLDSKVVY